MERSEPKLSRRRIEAHLLEPALASALAPAKDERFAYLVAVLPTSGTERRWAVVRDASGWSESSDFSLASAGAHDASREDYPIPTRLDASGAISGRLDLGARIVEHDPLDAAPRPFRWLLSFRTDPRQVWLDTTFSLEWTGPGGPRPLHGSGVTSFYFMNPLDDR
jgi:hypothetical protein